MRILVTSVCCSVVFLPIFGLSALANTTKELPQELVSLNSESQRLLRRESDATPARFPRQGKQSLAAQSRYATLAHPRRHQDTTEPALTVGQTRDRQNTAIAKQDYLAQNQWTTDSKALSPVAQNEETVAERAWTDSERDEAEQVKFKLQELRDRNFTPNRGAPALTLSNPYGFGADRGFYSSFSYQNDTRYGSEDENEDDAAMGFGFGFGDSRKAIGAELSYTLASFGNNRDFGTGGFNAKIHRQLGTGWGVAAGWNSFLTIGDDNDFEDSLYLVTTKIFKTRENLDSAFSRVSATVGVGNGRFRSEEAIENGDEQFNVFGSLAFRVAPPVSFVTEWTGQDLALGLSASPFRTIPVTINLGVRDLAGAGDGARFVAGIGTAF